MTFQLVRPTQIALLMVPVWPEFGFGAGRLAAAHWLTGNAVLVMPMW